MRNIDSEARQKMRVDLCIVMTFIACLTCARVNAAYIVHEFEGRFEHGELGGPVVPVSSAFRGLFAFEEGGHRVDEPFNGGVRSYYSPVYVELTVGNETISATNAEVQVRNAVTLFTDAFSVSAGTEVGASFDGRLNGNTIRLFSINLGGWQDTFAGSDYPQTIDLADFQGGNINLISGPLGSQALLSSSIRGGVQKLMEFTFSEGRTCDTPTCQIPEPHAIALAACGFTGLIAARSFRRARLLRAA
jgi:hypothetical protein